MSLVLEKYWVPSVDVLVQLAIICRQDVSLLSKQFCEPPCTNSQRSPSSSNAWSPGITLLSVGCRLPYSWSQPLHTSTVSVWNVYVLFAVAVSRTRQRVFVVRYLT